MEVKAMLKGMYLQMIDLDNHYKQQLQEKWGISTPTPPQIDT
jgi:hypothetical protein